MLHWLKAAESHTKPFGEKQGAFVIVAIDLPTKPHTHFPVSNGGVFDCKAECAFRNASEGLSLLPEDTAH